MHDERPADNGLAVVSAGQLIGVGISGWNDVQPVQPDLFEAPLQRKNKQRVLTTIDDVTEKFGKGLLQVGVPHRTPQR